MEIILEVNNLVKHYGPVVAVDGVSFALQQGVCFGLLGPNGAGKTTTIEVIEDVIQPTSGEIFYKGTLRTPTFREEVGIQFQSTALLNFLTVRETLQTFKSFFTQTASIEELVALCRLGEFLDQYNDKISGGQRQRIASGLEEQHRQTIGTVSEQRVARREYLVKLRQILDARFDEGELRTLCFDLGVDYDGLPGEGTARDEGRRGP